MSTGADQATYRVVGTDEELGTLDPEWERLLRLTPLASGFQSPAWVRSCRESLSRPETTPLTTVVTSASGTVAIFPADVDRHGRLGFIGEGVSNYAGPVFDPPHLDAALTAWAASIRESSMVRSIDLSGLREGNPFLDLLVRQGVPGWGRPLVVETNTCPEVDLSPGWEALYGRHRAKNRNTWRRMWRKLSGLGPLEYAEWSEPGQIREAMPRLFELFEARWAGQHVTGGMSPGLQPFHLRSSVRLARSGHALLSVLRLDGEIIAFNYGIRCGDTTSSYCLAHDNRFSRYSPGLLLLLRVLEEATRRGDGAYDFSLGEASYKDLWMSRERRTYRLLWGRGRRRRVAFNRAWVAARSVPTLRRLKLEGAKALVGRSRHAGEAPPAADTPGLAAGDGGRWRVYRVDPPSAPAGAGELRPLQFAEMERALSPRLVGLAVDRNFHGDDLLGLHRGSEVLGVVWRAGEKRREEVCGAHLPPGWTSDVYYQPVAATGDRLMSLVTALAEQDAAIVVTTGELEHVRTTKLGEFSAGLDLRPRDGDR